MSTVNFSSDNEDDNDINTPRTRNYDRIYSIIFFRATKTNIELNEKDFYIMAVTRNRLYQFIIPKLISFKQILGDMKLLQLHLLILVKYSLKILEENLHLMELI